MRMQAPYQCVSFGAQGNVFVNTSGEVTIIQNGRAVSFAADAARDLARLILNGGSQ